MNDVPQVATQAGLIAGNVLQSATQKEVMPQRIDPDGYFDGQRMRACSDTARLLWPLLYLAANGLGRLELDFENLIYKHFRGYKNPPTEEQLMATFAEYKAFHLAFLYESAGRSWCQFWVKDGFLPNHVLKKDKESPKPPAKEYQRWLESYPPKNKTLRQFFENVAKDLEKFQKISLGLGWVGLGSSGLDCVEKESLSQPVDGDPKPFDITDGKNHYRPCPNCGAKLGMGLRSKGYDAAFSVWVFCPYCDCSGPAAGTDESAFNLWNEMDRLTGGGSQAEAGPPLHERLGAELIRQAITPERRPHSTDSHKSGQSSRGKNVVTDAGTPSAEAAPLDGAGGGLQANARELTPPERGPAPTPPDESGPGPVEQQANEFGELAIREAKGRDGHTDSKSVISQTVKAVVATRQDSPDRRAEGSPTGSLTDTSPRSESLPHDAGASSSTLSDRSDGLTEDPLFNRLHAWFTSKRIGGSCKHLNMALQQFMSLREALILKSRWNPKTFEESWIKNGWDEAFAAGRQAGELEYWLRDYDPDGMVQWKKSEKGGARRVAGGFTDLTEEQARNLDPALDKELTT